MEDVNKSSSLGSIRFIRGPLAGQTFQITKSATTIGRAETNDIIVRGDPQVSRQHVRLLYNGGVWSIERKPDANIITVNEQEAQQALIHHNTTIGLGRETAFVFLLQAKQPTAPQPQQQYASQPPLSQQQYVPQPPLQQYVPQPPPQQSYVPQPPPQYSGPIQQQYDQLSDTLGVVSPRDTVIGRLQTSEDGRLQIADIPSFEVSSNISSDKQVYQLNKDVLSIGRNSQKENIVNDINVPHLIISKRHFQVKREGDQYVLIHPYPGVPGTVNGLLYQGRKIRGDEQFRHTLTRGDVFRIGNEQGTFITFTYNDGTGQQQEAVASVQDIRLSAPELTIGRKPDNTVVLAHPQVSGHHARLVREGGAYRIIDQNSTNHVYVNNQITTNQLLKLGDDIRIGPYKLIYEGTKITQYDESNFIRIDAQSLRKTGNNNVTLLNNISLTVPPRKFVALVGGSGAGKSTLMDALNGLRPAQQGKVLYNGQDYYSNLGAFSSQLGYVPQDDIVHRDLTVERALYYAAKMRLPSDFTNEQINRRISEVLEDVEMTPRRKLLVKKLSGGQRKRVSIALELLGNPSLFFLDEPTSGLDPGLDRKMMFLLRKLADAGHTIVLVTHATNNINTCDYVCFLCQGGRLAYFGPPDGAKAYFGKNDFAEIYTSLEPTEANPNVPEEAEARFRNSDEYKKYVAYSGGPPPPKPVDKRKRPKRGNPLSQFLLLSQRNLELLKNDTSNLIILLLQAPLIALLLLFLIYSEVGSGIFDANNVVQCLPQISTSVIKTSTPGGRIGIDTGGKTNLVNCGRIVDYLKSNTGGIKDVTINPRTGKTTETTNTNGTDYAKNKGGVNKALQDFITVGKDINAQRALFLITFVAVLFGCINGTREIVKEASIYRRERTVNLGIVPYILSKFLVLGLFALFQSAALLLIVQLFEPLHQGIFLPVILEIYITLVLTAFAGLMIGLTASAFAANEDSANSLLPFLLIPQVVFAGVEIPLKSWVLQIIGVAFPTRWAMAAVGSSIGLHGDKLGSDGDKLFGNDLSYHGTLFSTFTQTDAMHRLQLSWGVLGAIILVLAIMTGIALKRKDIRS